MAGIYGNDADEAMYPMAKADSKGEKLNCSNHKYTLTFAAGQMPPVNAFWSVTMYDGNTQLLIENPINRYLINTPMVPQLKKNADGSLTIYIQKDAPAGDKKATGFRSRWTHLHGDAPLLAEDRTAFDPSSGRGLHGPPVIEVVQ